MTAPRTTVWALEPHTRAKHEILRRYLEAWSAIMVLGRNEQRFEAIAYVDGFAGPGVYANGEDGSPIIALKAALGHHAALRPGTKLLFLFIERDADRARQLAENVAALQLPAHFRVRIAQTNFEEGIRANLLDLYERRGLRLPPTFAFIDPFGWSHTPFELVKELLAHPHCEVLINFMYEEVNRFAAHPDHPATFDRLFGTDRWRQVLGIGDPHERRRVLHGVYLEQLRTAAGARYVRSFEMRNVHDATDYFLFFATNSRKGIQKMKEAMWRVDASGEFRFSDATNPAQLLLFGAQPDLGPLRRALVEHFAGREASVEEIEEHVLAETPFRETHYKRHVLAALERDGQLEIVSAPPGRRRGTFPAGVRLRFRAGPGV